MCVFRAACGCVCSGSACTFNSAYGLLTFPDANLRLFENVWREICHKNHPKRLFSKLLECVEEQCVRSLDEVIDKLDGSGQPESLSNKRLNVLNSLRDLMVAAILFFDSTKTRDPTIAFGIQSTSYRGRLQMSC